MMPRNGHPNERKRTSQNQRHRADAERRGVAGQRFVFHRAKKVYFFKIIPLDGVFPARLVSDSWRRCFSATVSKHPEESRQGE
jgi:hypothetical protein